MSRGLPGFGALFGLVVGLVFSAWPETHLQVAQDDLCILCTHGVSTRAKKRDSQEWDFS